VKIVTLKGGLRVANFSSPHPFVFDTGETLEAFTPERARALMLDQVEVETSSPCGRWVDVRLEFRMSGSVLAEMLRLAEVDEADFVMVPLPVSLA
jgi:hypothetical protein